MILTRADVDKYCKFSLLGLSFFSFKFTDSSVNLYGVTYGRGKITMSVGRRALEFCRTKSVVVERKEWEGWDLETE